MHVYYHACKKTFFLFVYIAYVIRINSEIVKSKYETMAHFALCHEVLFHRMLLCALAVWYFYVPH